MRRMSEGVEHALHCVFLLAGLEAGAALPGKALAEFHGVSESYLLKHLKALTAAGVVVSVSGPRGGYRLARPAEAVTMLEVVEAIDGTEPAFRCTEIRRCAPSAVKDGSAYPGDCFIKRRMLAAEGAWRAALAKESIADLLAEGAYAIDPRNQANGAAWMAANARKSKSA